MTTPMRIKQIWEELENDNSSTKGLLIRRYSGAILPDVFVAIQQPEKLFCIATSISKTVDINITPFANLQEIQVTVIPDTNNATKNILLFKLINNQHKEIFAVLCEDLIISIANETNEKKLIHTILNRFEKWKSLFDKISLGGLTPEKQRGLFGELFFLRKFLIDKSNNLQVLNTWVGPSNEIRDFQFENWALEVKTTIGNNHQKVQISSERQLDITHLERLYLFHISLEKAQENGETLNEIVKSIQSLLHLDIIALNRFRAKLYEVGYFENDEHLYESIGYHIRQDTFYKVENEFPRLQENEIRSGVGDVKYSIILSQCQQYINTESQVLENLSI